MLFSILAALGFFAVVLSLLAWRSNLYHSEFVVDQQRMAFLTKLAWAAGAVAAIMSYFASAGRRGPRREYPDRAGITTAVALGIYSVCTSRNLSPSRETR